MIRNNPLAYARGSATFFLAVAFCLAQTPEVINGTPQTRAVAGSLANDFHAIERSAASPMWMAYSIPAVHGENQGCGDGMQHNKVLRLEGSDSIIVLYRFENHALDRVRIGNPDCQIDAGGLPFLFLTGVSPAQSVELLSDLGRTWTQTGHKAHFDTLVAALALHRDPAADRALDVMIAPSQPETLREKGLFWLAEARGHHGFEAVRNALAHDSNDRIREKAAFDITVSKEPGVTAALIESAQKDRTPKVRSQALFWLAHHGGKQESPVIVNAAKQDPDASVRRQAVFALSQIPNGDGVPMLIQIARTGTDSEVRKQAVFWLGQSHDPRASAFIESVLTK